nr:MAG TPA: nuclease [Caudoviricetes sp.]
MQFVNLTDEQRKQIATEQASKNIQPMPMEKGLQTEILPFSLNPLKLFGGVTTNAAADVAGADRDYRADISNAKSTDEIKSAVNNAISKFDNANPLIFGGDDVKKQKSEFLKNVSNSIRQSKLAYGLSEYNGNLYLRKGDELFDLDDGLIKQIGRVMRDNAGSMAGAALSYKKGGGFLQNMAGGALGAAGGSGVDHLNNSNYAGQEANLANAAKKMGEEALFSVAGDALIGAAAKYGKPTLNLAGKVADKMPLLNLGKQAIEGVPTANVKGAMKSAEAIAGDEAEAMLKNAAEVGGYKVDGGNITDLQLLNPIINKAKDFSARAAQKLHLDDAAAAINNTRGLDAEREKILSLALSDRKSAERLLNALRGDKSGRGARNLADLAQSDVNRLREIIGQSETTDLKDVVEQYYKATKDDFDQAIDNLDAFKNGQKIKLSDDAIEQMKQEYSSNSNIFDKSSDKTRGVMEGFDSLKGRELGVRDLNDLRANYNKGLNDILNSDKNSYATKVNFIKGKEILERAMDDLLGDDAARAYLRENLAQYKDFKGFERSPLFKAITNIESSAQDVMNAFRGLRDTQGGLYDKFISKLSPEQAQKFELAAIKDDFEGALGKTGTFNVREILNGKELNEALQKTSFKSERAKEIVKEIDKLAKARGNLAEIFAALDSKFIMPTRFNKGIATTFSGASKTAFVNAVRQTALKYVPIIGNDAALEYHLREAAKAIKSGGTLEGYAKTMEKNGASKEQAKAFADLVKETAEQGSKLEQAEAKQEVVKGDGWTMKDGGAAKTDYVIKTDLAPNVRDLSKITTDEKPADLEYLAAKHPEIFDKPSDVFKLIKEIKENPTHFFTNNRLDYALIVKRLEDNKIGKLAVDKQSGEVKHATKVNSKDLKRLAKVSKEKSENAGIIQTFIQPGSKSQGELGLPTKRIISQNAAKDETAIKTYVNPHVGAGLASGTLNAKDENGNFDAEKFAKGFLYGLFGSKVTAATLKKTNPKLYDQIVKIAEGNASKEKISSFVNKLKQDELGKLLQKTVTNKDLSTKTKVEIIEAAKGRYAQAIKNEQTKKAIEASAQKGRDMTPIGRENLNAEIVEYLTNNRQNVAIDVLSPKIAQKLGFRYANVKRTISSDAVRHTINRHGKDSDLVKKSGQKPVAYDDIAKWAQYADEADVQAITKDNIKQDVLISGKQLSEHYYVVVESIRKKANELAFKTMYFEKGSLKNSEAFKDAQTLLRGYEPDANSFAPLKD